MATFELPDVVARRKSRALMGAYALVTSLPLIVLLTGAMRLLPFIQLAIVALLVPLAVLMHRRRVEDRGTLRVDGDVLSLGGAVLTRRHDVEAAYLSSDGEGPVVRFARKWWRRNIDVRVPAESDARALLASFGVDRSRRPSRFLMAVGRHANQWRLLAIFGVLGLAAASGAIAAWRFLPLWPGVTVALSLISVPLALSMWTFVYVTVGEDGVLVSRWFGARRFIHYADLEGVRAEGRDLVLLPRAGRPVVAHFGGVRGILGSDLDMRLEGLVRAIEDARRAHAQGSTASALLARSGRNGKAWLAALRGATEERAGFRAVALPAEQLWRVVADPGAAPTERAAAAVVLRETLDDQGRARLRVMSEATASPQLRVALAAAADAPNDDVLASALDRLEEAPPRRRALGRDG
jgi:hypothetical protein